MYILDRELIHVDRLKQATTVGTIVITVALGKITGELTVIDLARRRPGTAVNTVINLDLVYLPLREVKT